MGADTINKRKYDLTTCRKETQNTVNQKKKKKKEKTRQRNMQQIKECGDNPQDQTNDKFRVMLVKMIQNFGNKMEAQINIMEKWIEKIQEMFNKNLEEIKKMNNQQ